MSNNDTQERREKEKGTSNGPSKGRQRSSSQTKIEPKSDKREKEKDRDTRTTRGLPRSNTTHDSTTRRSPAQGAQPDPRKQPTESTKRDLTRATSSRRTDEDRRPSREMKREDLVKGTARTISNNRMKEQRASSTLLIPKDEKNDGDSRKRSPRRLSPRKEKDDKERNQTTSSTKRSGDGSTKSSTTRGLSKTTSASAARDQEVRKDSKEREKEATVRTKSRGEHGKEKEGATNSDKGSPSGEQPSSEKVSPATETSEHKKENGLLEVKKDSTTRKRSPRKEGVKTREIKRARHRIDRSREER